MRAKSSLSFVMVMTAVVLTFDSGSAAGSTLKLPRTSVATSMSSLRGISGMQ